jgi:hypothetical protein
LGTDKPLSDILKAQKEFITSARMMPQVLVVSNKDVKKLKDNEQVSLLSHGEVVQDDGIFSPMPYLTLRESSDLESGKARLECSEPE